MSEWIRVTKCPDCGGELEISEHYAYSLDFKITKKGVLSNRPRKSSAGPIDCITAFCYACNRSWDAMHVSVESDGSVFLRG